jgi:ribosomal protein L37AE/L43A
MKPFERSETTDKLVKYLLLQDKGTQTPYQELSKIVGHKIQARSTNLISARQILERDHNQIWVCVQPGSATAESCAAVATKLKLSKSNT